MKAIKIILITVAIIVIIIVAFMWYAGFFASFKIEEKEMGPFTVVYEEHVGDYSKTGDIQMKVYKSLLQDKVETFRGFGLYYDDPKTVEKSKLRSIVGCILEDKDSLRIPELSSKYKIQTINRTYSMVVEFPFKNTMHIFAGIMKVYPALGKYIKEHSYQSVPGMEIYDVPNKKIIYIMEIKK